MHRSRPGLVRSLLAATMAALVTAGGAAGASMSIAAEPPAGTVTVDYDVATGVIANPDRGFYHHTETHYDESGAGYVPLDGATLGSWRAEGITQVQRVVYMEKFADQAVLDPAWLDLVAADFATARAAGVSIVLRFAYLPGQGSWPYSAPYGDADVPTVLGHIDQLTPLLRANADVIAVLQAGFIGYWGEWYYTDHFVADPSNPGVVTPADWANRRLVVDALLAALPQDRMVQVRTMRIKQELFGVSTGSAGALTDAQAHDGSPIARVGHHNDCFLADETDFGTFLSAPLDDDREYLEQDSRYVPMGGETCNVNAPRSEWPSAATDLERYHWSFLNADYLQAVLNSWGPANLNEVRKRLGYRFTMQQSRVRTEATADGGGISLEVDISNDGWAAPYQERPVNLVLNNASVGDVVVPIDTDPRRWAPGTTTTVAVDICDVPPGTYDASLWLPSAQPSLRYDSRYAIQFANDGTWEGLNGRNQLNREVVVGEAASQCGGPVDLDVATTASPSSVSVGDQVTLSASVTHRGPFTGPIDADLTMTVPAGLRLEPASLGASTLPVTAAATGMLCVTATSQVECAITALALGDTATMSVLATVTAIPSGPPVVTVTSGRFDAVPANDSADITFAVAPAPVPPDPIDPDPIDPDPIDPDPIDPDPIDPDPTGPIDGPAGTGGPNGSVVAGPTGALPVPRTVPGSVADGRLARTGPAELIPIGLLGVALVVGGSLVARRVRTTD